MKVSDNAGNPDKINAIFMGRAALLSGGGFYPQL
jgi:hypothetical protein